MSADWIKIRTDLSDDPALVVIARATGLDRASVIGRLVILWTWANRHTTDGKIPGVDSDWLDDMLDAPDFFSGMQQAGWIKQTKTGLTFLHFDRHNSDSAKTRALVYQRVKRHRAAQKCNAKVKRSRNAPTVTESLPEKEKEKEVETEQEKDKTKSANAGAFAPARNRKSNQSTKLETFQPVGRNDSIRSADQYMIQPHVAKLWSQLPKRVRHGKTAISTELVKAVEERGADPEYVVARMLAYYESPQGKGKYHVSPAHFIERGHYDDADEAWQASRGIDHGAGTTPKSSQRLAAQRAEDQRIRDERAADPDGFASAQCGGPQ